MARRRRDRRKQEECAYCARQRVCEKEHVFPESWYPDGHAPSQMLTVPGCAECNRRFGKVEERLFLLFAGTLPSLDPRFAGIRKRADRAINPLAARPGENPRYRQARRRRLFDQFRVFQDDDEVKIWNPLPRRKQRLVTPAGLHVEGIHAIEFPMIDLETFGAKLARGGYRALFGKPLNPSIPTFTQPFGQPPNALFEAFDTEPGTHLRGAFPFVARVGISEGESSMMWMFSLWDHVVLLVCTGALAVSGAEKAISHLRSGPVREPGAS